MKSSRGKIIARTARTVVEGKEKRLPYDPESELRLLIGKRELMSLGKRFLHLTTDINTWYICLNLFVVGTTSMFFMCLMCVVYMYIYMQSSRHVLLWRERNARYGTLYTF